MSESLTADKILARIQPHYAPVSVEMPEWGGTVHVRKLSSTDLDRYYESLKGSPADRVRGLILATAICDANGIRLYSDSDAKQLAGLPALESERIVDAFFAANGIGSRGPK